MAKKEKDARKGKPPIKAERISLDDFEVEVDGETYHPHLGEWIEIIPIRRLSELKNLMELASYQPLEGETPSFTDPRLMKQYDGICNYLCATIYRWNMTDEEGTEYPQPYHQQRAIELLPLEEINYITAKIIGGRTDNSKSETGEAGEGSGTGGGIAAVRVHSREIM